MPEWIKNWFSNFNELEVPITAQGITYYTVENFFQAMKTTDHALRILIANMSPGSAKKFCGRKNKEFKLRDGWDDIKLDVMLWALRKKFAPGTKALKQLLDTGTEIIVEKNNWHDCYWGSCQCERCKDIPHLNNLGILLMQIRVDAMIKEADRV
jgi:ribA/ribD-fused uncharacterized protein